MYLVLLWHRQCKRSHYSLRNVFRRSAEKLVQFFRCMNFSDSVLCTDALAQIARSASQQKCKDLDLNRRCSCHDSIMTANSRFSLTPDENVPRLSIRECDG